VEQDLWVVRTTALAKSDLAKILRWTSAQFGAVQAQVYLETMTQALEDLCAGPDIVGSKVRSDIAQHMHTLHVGRKGRKGRHFLMFRVRRLDSQRVIEVVRILHDSMDLVRHQPP
jgi:toxin ParE1/3/4